MMQFSLSGGSLQIYGDGDANKQTDTNKREDDFVKGFREHKNLKFKFDRYRASILYTYPKI